VPHLNPRSGLPGSANLVRMPNARSTACCGYGLTERTTPGPPGQNFDVLLLSRSLSTQVLCSASFPPVVLESGLRFASSCASHKRAWASLSCPFFWEEMLGGSNLLTWSLPDESLTLILFLPGFPLILFFAGPILSSSEEFLVQPRPYFI